MKVRDIIGLVDWTNTIIVSDGKISISEDNENYPNYFNKEVITILGTNDNIILEVE